MKKKVLIATLVAAIAFASGFGTRQVARAAADPEPILFVSCYTAE